jgi:type II secretory pathway predicted ATPase ExeA
MNALAVQEAPPDTTVSEARRLFRERFARGEYMPLKLKAVLNRIGMTQAALASRVMQTSGRPMTQAAMTNILNYGQWPTSSEREFIQSQIEEALLSAGATADEIRSGFEIDAEDPARGKPVKKPQLHVVGSSDVAAPTTSKGLQMFFRAEALRPAARRQFKLVSNPFGTITDPAQIFMWEDWRYAREALWDAAKNGAFRAIVGESGSGKTTLVQELRQRIDREQQPMVLIEPYVIAMEETEARGRPLRSEDIIDATIKALDPRAVIPHRSQARFDLAHDMLMQSARAGYKHLMLFEEAHALPQATLKQLKRWLELRDGLRPLLGIALVAQPELKIKLNERNPAVREIVQRLEIVDLLPLDDALQSYLTARLKACDLRFDDIFDAGAIDAMRERLTHIAGNRKLSICYPLAVGNLAARCINAAADIGASRVTADVVKGA